MATKTKPKNKPFRKFWAFKALDPSEDGLTRAEMALDGEFSDAQWWGDEITSANFRQDLTALGAIDELTLNVNSRGGDVFAAMAIRNILQAHDAKKIGVVQGIAASAATLPLTACDEVHMHTGSMMLVHCASDFAYGMMKAEDHQKSAEDLEAINAAIVDCYAEFTGQTPEAVRAQMDTEAYMSADECVDFGLATDVIPGESEEEEPDGAFEDPNNPDMWNIAGKVIDFTGVTIRPVAMLKPAPAAPLTHTASASTRTKRAAAAAGQSPRTPDAAAVRKEILDAERKRVNRLQAFAGIPGADELIKAAIDSDEDPGITAEKILLACKDKIVNRARHGQRFLDAQQVNQVPSSAAVTNGDGPKAQQAAQRTGIVGHAVNFLKSIGRAKEE